MSGGGASPRSYNEEMGLRSAALLAALLAGALRAQDISATRLRADVQFLASDLLEGRGTGTRGGALAEEYIAAQMQKADLRPGYRGTWYQTVSLIGVQTLPEVELVAVTASGVTPLVWLTDFAGQSRRQIAETGFDAPVVFAGHGITAPEFNWDDWQGLDARGKACLMLANEPASATDRSFFDGPALTYYGRWTYKFEQATRQGCAAALLIHTDSSAGYAWSVVRNSWGREEAQTPLPAAAAALAFAGWLSRDAAARLIELDSRGLEQVIATANNRGFRGHPMRFRLRGRIPSRIRSIAARNVVGMVEGGDPALSGQAVIFSAHADHLGIDTEAPPGADRIFNGAVDNATGTAMLLELARAWAALPRPPARTAFFLATTAEEAGLKGAEAYAADPAIPLDQTALNLNFDSYYPAGRVSDLILDRAERTTLWPHIERIAARYGMTVKPQPHPGSGAYFRSDHFAFARLGVPAFSVGLGSSFLADGERHAALIRDYGATRYHRPGDEFSPDWDFSGLVDAARIGLEIGLAAANNPPLTRWIPSEKTTRRRAPRKGRF